MIFSDRRAAIAAQLNGLALIQEPREPCAGFWFLCFWLETLREAISSGRPETPRGA